MEPTFVIGSIGSEGKEFTTHTKKDESEVSFMHPVNFTGSFTTGSNKPEGEVMKLALTNLPAATTQETEPIFGKHLREAVAIVKDWHRNP